MYVKTDRPFLPPLRATGNVVLFLDVKKTFKGVVRNQVPIDHDDEHDDYDGDDKKD